MSDMQFAKQVTPTVVPSGPARARSRTVRVARNTAILVLLILVCALLRTLVVRASAGKMLAVRSAENAVMHVRVTHATRGNDDRLVLPGTLQARMEAQINPRASGYVTAVYKDIGATVRQGELLASIDMPEVKRQVDEADANYQPAKLSLERWSHLRDVNMVSVQALDEKTRVFRQTEAVLKRTRAQLAFGQIVAPFAGVVTRRTVHVGDLVTADRANDGAGLFVIARTSALHVYLYLPEHSAARVQLGDTVELVLAEHPGKVVTARITRTAGVIDRMSHTLQVDVDVPNADLALLPGSYVEATLRVPPNKNLVLPTNTLLFSAAGPQVAVVRNGTVQRVDVSLGTDFGRTVEIRRGVAETDAVIVNPSDVIVQGQTVVIEATPAAAKRS
jgi:multidrug efflux system membrane fusion protein